MSHKAALILGALVTAIASAASAEPRWPDHPVHVVVPFAAGSLVDIVPRIIFDHVSVQTHQVFVIENRPGASGTLGAAAVAKSNRDGYTILVNSNAQVLASLFYRNLGYDASRDFAAVAPLVSYANVLVISRNKNIGTVDDFVRTAKAQKGKMTFASLGVGTATYMTAERFRVSAGFEATHVPFKGAPEAIREVMEGRVDYCFCAIGTTLPFIRQRTLIALAVSTPMRSAFLPEVPTTLERGFANSDYTPWLGLFAPSRTPPNVIGKLHDRVVDALRSHTVEEKLAAFSVGPMVLSLSDFDSFVKREAAINSALVRQLDLRAH
jgi:tripartite-type tricarboxylate transporter receptor subunit TctC